MSNRTAFLLSPYGLPTDHPLMLSEPEMAAWWNGYLALWHPAVLAGLSAPAKQASQYDHETPTPGHIFAVPDAPELYMPDDWRSRVQNSSAAAFTATANRGETLAHLKQALAAFDRTPEAIARLELSPERVTPFLAIGFGYLVVEHLFDAMQHEHILANGDFWTEVQHAVAALTDPDPIAFRAHLQHAADKLQAAREVLYPVAIHLLDFVLPDERKLNETLPKSFDSRTPVNLIAGGSLLECIREEFPERFAEIKQRINDSSGAPTLELCTGAYSERDDTLLPVESQLWNLRKGIQTAKDLLGVDAKVYARKKSSFSPQTPQFLLATGYEKAILLAFDGAVVPSHRSTVTSWSSPDGKQIDGFTRAPQPAHQSQTFFNIVHALHETIMQDTAATYALVHTENQPAACYHDWLNLSAFGPILGQWTTISNYLGQATAGEYAPANTADDFSADWLDERSTAHLPDAVSGFARHLRQRRRLDTALGHLALLRGLGAGASAEAASLLESELEELETRLEGGPAAIIPQLVEVEQKAAQLLADRLQVHSADGTAGFMLLNPCSFIRRMSLELDGVTGPIPVNGPVKAAQFDPDKARLVVEVPAFGFAWIPRSATGSALPRARMKLADTNMVRNEFFEAEIDLKTGALKAFRDLRTRISRVGQQLVFNPGSVMQAKQVKVTCVGPALGEVTSEGAILNEHGEVLATFRQRFRAWLGRPLLEIRIEIYPEKQPEGYPWHAYFGSRFAWRDERATLLRGGNASSYITNHTRPVSPDFLEVRNAGERTTIFPCGLPFLHRHGGRMVDVILIPEGEQAKSFDIALGLDREYPAQTALGLGTPATVVPTTKGPPPAGASGWLFHLDAPNLVMTSLRPGRPGERATSAIVARLLECTTFGGAAELRCARNPVGAATLDANGNTLTKLSVNGDAVSLDVLASDMQSVRVDFA
jgi:hypothetical protein